MKKILVIFSLAFIVSTSIQAQDKMGDSITADSSIYIAKLVNGRDIVGKLISADKSEVVILTDKLGEIAIRKYDIETLRKADKGEFSADGKFIPNQVFSTRYFISTNGLPIEKGENYVLWNLWGPEIHLGLADNLSVGVMTTWLAVPVIASAKYSLKTGEKSNIGLGLLAGSTLWVGDGAGFVLPYAAFTTGTRRANLTFSGGYGVFGEAGNSNASAIFSIAGMAGMSRKTTFVFDSWMMPNQGFYLFLPGIRIQTKAKSAFQFAFGGGYVEEYSFPLPYFGWFRKF